MGTSRRRGRPKARLLTGGGLPTPVWKIRMYTTFVSVKTAMWTS
jgi:hypothetical protein